MAQNVRRGFFDVDGHNSFDTPGPMGLREASDNHSNFLSDASECRSILMDGLHFKAKGQAMVADLMLAKMEEAFPELRCGVGMCPGASFSQCSSCIYIYD